MSRGHRNIALVRRQRQSGKSAAWEADANDCLADVVYEDEYCDLPDGRCSADDHDWMWQWYLGDCGREIAEWWREGLIARCPLAFVHDRGSSTTPQRTTPRPVATPTLKTTSTPAVVAPATSVSSVRAPVVAITTTRTLAIPSSDAVLSPANDRSLAPTSVTLEAGQISDSSTDSEEASATLTETISSEEAGSSVDVAASQLAPSASDGVDGERSLDDQVNSDTSAPQPERSLGSATSGSNAASGKPLLGPLDPSSPGQVSKLNGGVIAGLIIAVLAVIAIFLALWYRSYRRRQRASIQTYQFSSPMPTTFDGPSGSETWTQFGGAKGSMIPSNHEVESEKDAPIYNMFSRRAVPSSPMMSSIRGGRSLASVTPSSSRQLSGKVSRSSGRGMLSSMKSKWIDGGRTPPPPYLNDDGSLASPKLYKRPHGTSFFARLLSNPVPRVPVQAVYVGPELPHPHFNASQPVTQSLQTLSEEREPRHSDDSSVSSQALSLPFEVDENSGREDLAPFPPSMLPGKTPADSVYEGYSRTLLSRPSVAWTDKSLPRDMSVFEEGEEVDDPRAASTRAPSLDLTWVTQGDSRISVPTWAAPRKRYSIRSKKSSKSAHNRSDHRHSIMSTMTSPSIALSKSTRTSSSGPSRSAHSSTGPIPDMPSFHSIPSFRLELGLDKAKPSSGN